MNERPEDSAKGSEPESLLPIDEHVEEGQDAEGRKVRHRGIYLLPNLFTTAALFSGFYAIINGMNGQFDHAAIALEAKKRYNSETYYKQLIQLYNL